MPANGSGGDPNLDPAVTVCFAVEIDGHPMGAFTSCEGLGFEVTVEQREEGGTNGFVYQLPGRIKYTNIKLTRAVTKDSAKVAGWVAQMAASTHPKKRSTATITAMTSNYQPVATWSLMGVIPVKWTGPQLNADGPKVATETIELAHHGFDPAETGPAPGAL